MTQNQVILTCKLFDRLHQAQAPATAKNLNVVLQGHWRRETKDESKLDIEVGPKIFQLEATKIIREILKRKQ
jgi:hypothetical protein